MSNIGDFWLLQWDLSIGLKVKIRRQCWEKSNLFLVCKKSSKKKSWLGLQKEKKNQKIEPWSSYILPISSLSLILQSFLTPPFPLGWGRRRLLPDLWALGWQWSKQKIKGPYYHDFHKLCGNSQADYRGLEGRRPVLHSLLHIPRPWWPDLSYIDRINLYILPLNKGLAKNFVQIFQKITSSFIPLPN